MKLHCDEAKNRFLGVDVQFRSEPSAHFRCNYAKAIFRYAKHQSDLSAHEVGYLRRTPEGELLFAWPVARKYTTRFKRYRCEPLVSHLLAYNAISSFKCGINVTHASAVNESLSLIHISEPTRL